MTRSELLERASGKLGQNIAAHRLDYAMKAGRIRPGKQLPDGWMEYDERHVAELVKYCRTRSHRQRATA